MANTNNSPDGGGEKLQIAILTFFMTAGGFLVLTLVFSFLVNPLQDTRMKAAEKTYEDLCKLLQQDDVRRLRQQDRLNQEKGDEEDLRQLISQNLSTYGLEFRDFRPMKRSIKKGGITEVTQQITLQAASMTPVLQFVAAVQGARKSVRVASLDLTRNKRAAADSDSWQTSVIFIDYETGAGSP